jgi:diaminohydroxyphosphoribosylaminopyrimidine deaminase/5-amino-6-(5-phosphoribosylamino)uracil reductase
MVGCVIVKNGQVIGRGFHERPGKPHAEPAAIAAATESVRGATLYVNLEPCSHHGRTPPCADTLVAAGVGRVVAGMVDPNPVVSGSGLARLMDAGIELTAGVLERECRELNEGFLSHFMRERAWVTAKFATSLDGRIATRTGESKWITSDQSREVVHQQRAEHDAIVVGIGTVLADDPLLTHRIAGCSLPQPHRYVLDRQLRTPVDAKLLNASVAPITIVCGHGADAARAAALRAKGATVLELPVGASGIDPTAFTQHLSAHGQFTLFVEGGAGVLGSFFDAGLVDRLHAFIAPKIIGGAAAPAAVGGIGPATMDAVHLAMSSSWEKVGPDLHATALFTRL